MIINESNYINESIVDNKWNRETNDTYNFFSGNYFSMVSIQSNMKDGITGIYYIINSTNNKGEVVSGTISCDQSNVNKKLEKLKKEITDMINNCKKSGKKLTKIKESVEFNPDQFLSVLSFYNSADDAYMKLYRRDQLPSGARCNRTNNSIEVHGYRFKPKQTQVSKNPPKFKYDGEWTYSKM